MVSPLYHIVFYGNIRPGFSEDQVRRNLKQHLALSDSTINTLFSRPRVVIKRHVEAATAFRYEQQFFLQGMAVKLEAVDGENNASLLLPEDKEAPQQNMISERASLDSAPAPIGNSDTDSPCLEPLGFTFTGNGKEYFKIWIVNLLLTVLTLGIYSAWAKVRNKQYFYGNTRLDNASFEYTAKPLQILAGRMVAFAVIASYVVLSHLLPPAEQVVFGAVALLFFIVVTPWVVVKSVQFNARHSRYRNISFGFDGSYWEAFKAFVLWPLTGVLIFLIPLSWHRQARFFVNNSRYGASPFRFGAVVGDYYHIFGMLCVLSFGLSFGLALFGGLFAALLSNPVAILPVVGLFYFLLYIVVGAYFTCHMNNLMYNAATLEGHGLSSNYEFTSYFKLLLTNTLGIVLTLLTCSMRIL